MEDELPSFEFLKCIPFDKCEIQFSIIPGKQIIIKEYVGDIGLEHIFKSWEIALEASFWDQNITNFILDYRRGHFNFPVGDLNKVAAFYQKHISLFGGKKIAFISEKPEEIVVPIIFGSKDKGYVTRTFSTYEGALNWVSH